MFKFLIPRKNLNHFESTKTLIYNFPNFSIAQIRSNLPFRFSRIPQFTNPIPIKHSRVSFYSTRTYRGPITRSLRRRISRRNKASSKPTLNDAAFHRSLFHLPPNFTPDELHNVIALQSDPLVCLELFNWASHQPTFRHSACTYHATIKKLGAAKMYEEMDTIVNQVLAIPSIASEPLYNTMIYYFTEARKLIRAVNIFNHMRNSRKFDCRPSIKTYSILFGALLSKGSNSFVNHLYMETIRKLFKRMVDDNIEPDVFCLNCMVQGYVLSLHVNDALRIFHQMEAVFNCEPNSFTYDCLIHGFCVQGRTRNAKELCDEMKGKAFFPSVKACNSLVNSLALEGEVDESVRFLWEMAENDRVADLITYRTVVGEVSRKKSFVDARRLLEDLNDKGLIDGVACREILWELEDGYQEF